MHLAWQDTSPASQASMQAMAEDCAGVREPVAEGVSRAVPVPVVVGSVWAEAKTARAPVRMKVVKRMLTAVGLVTDEESVLL